MWRTVAVSMGALTAFIGLAFGSAQPSEEVLRAREERRAKAERLAELNAAAEKEREVQAAADLAAAQELLPELTKDWEAERKRIDSRFRTKVDDMEDVSFHSPRKSPRYVNSYTTVYGHYQTNPSSGELRWAGITFNYAGSQWVFFDSVILKVDEERYELTFPKVSRDHAGGKVGETVSVPVRSPVRPRELVIDPELAARIAKAKVVKVRFQGKRYKDHVLQVWEKQSFGDVAFLRRGRPSIQDAIAEVQRRADQQGK